MTGKSLIEIGGKANIVLSFVTNTTINGKSYLANEPYLYLKDVVVLLNYKEHQKNSSSIKHVMNKNLIALDKITVGNLQLTRKLMSLLIQYTGSSVSGEKKEFFNLTCDTNTIYLTKIPSDTDKIFVYDTDFNKVADITYTAATNSITSTNFIDTNNYIVSFSSELVGTRYNLNQSTLPYMSMQIQGIGNIDKIEKEIIINLEKVALNSIVDFNFINNDMINIPLEFIVIDDSNNYIILED